MVLDALTRVISQVTSEDQRLEQMATLLGLSLFAKFVYICIVLFKTSHATRLHPNNDWREASVVLEN